jgi:hypothetical protein
MLATQSNTLRLSGVTDIDLQMSMHALGLAEWTHEFHSINPKYLVQLMHTREPGTLSAWIKLFVQCVMHHITRPGDRVLLELFGGWIDQ